MSATRDALIDPAALAEGRRLLVGIAGPPGAGKSTLADALVAELAADGIPAVVLPMDGFHLPQARLVELGRRDRMGAPDTFDTDGFAEVLAELRDASSTIRAPGFDRAIEEPVPDALRVGPEVRVVVVEGNYLLAEADGWQRIRPLLDRVGYLAVPDTVRRRRLVARHVAFGKTPDAATAWVADVDEPNAALIAGGAGRADVTLTLRQAQDDAGS